MKISMDLTRFKAGLQQKKTQIREATRPAAQAGAQVIYAQAKINVPVSPAGTAHIFRGSSYKKTGQEYLFYSGDLRDSIYQVYSKDNSGESKATYHIAWNHKKAPYGFMVEFGTSRTPAHPFLRPAIVSQSAAAARAMKAEFIKRANA